MYKKVEFSRWELLLGPNHAAKILRDRRLCIMQTETKLETDKAYIRNRLLKNLLKKDPQ